MMRIVLILLAVLIAVLSFVLDQPWLYWAAGALLIVAVGALASHLWQMYSETKQYQRKGDAGSKEREKELRELGIMDVRPKQQTRDEPPEAPAEALGEAEQASAPPASSKPSTASEASRSESTHSAAPARASDESASVSTGAEAEDPSAVGPYLEALRRVLRARTACLLVQDEMALEYRIEGIRSTASDVHPAGTTFTTDEPLLTAGMSQQEVTVQIVGDAVPRAALGYYTGSSSVTQLAVAPVPRSETSSYFVLVDGPDDAPLASRRARRLLTRFAEGLSLLIEAEAAPSEPSPAASEALEPEQAADPSAGSSANASAGPAGDGASPRPRSEIIAEEMARVDSTEQHLALALVHLNRAERIAEEGAEAVAAAEDELRDRLRALAPESRIERFGELTFGVFYHGAAADVEPWAERLQEEMGQASGALEGGVSIGVAVWSNQAPEVLRGDATEALRVAYETGDCTIVE